MNSPEISAASLGLRARVELLQSRGLDMKTRDVAESSGKCPGKEEKVSYLLLSWLNVRC